MLNPLEKEIVVRLVERLKVDDVDIDSLESGTQLFGQGLQLDSIDALEIELMIKEDYGIVILTSERTHSTFGTIGDLANFVQQNLHRDIRKTG